MRYGATRPNLKLMPGNSIRSLSKYVTLMTSSNLPQFALHAQMVAPGNRRDLPRRALDMHTMVMERRGKSDSESARFSRARRRCRCLGGDLISR